MVVTFVTSSNPNSVKKLDNRRLNKQIVEAKQILDTLLAGRKAKGWRNHPAVLMWIGHTDALKVYINCCIKHWKRRGGKCKLKMFKGVNKDNVKWPWWYTWKQFHLSHKCSLLRKDPKYYGKRFTLDRREEKWLKHGYIWPSKLDDDIDINHRYRPKEVCSPIGAGAPAQYRWSKKEARMWNKNRCINPRTGRAISPTAKTGIYKDIEKAYKYYVSVGEL